MGESLENLTVLGGKEVVQDRQRPEKNRRFSARQSVRTCQEEMDQAAPGRRRGLWSCTPGGSGSWVGHQEAQQGWSR